MAVLAAYGFEPFEDDDKIRLHNCPFHLLARQFPPLICGMNLALVEGIMDGLGGPEGLTHLDPAPGRCCVAVHRSPPLSDLPGSNTYAD
jgi:predicted ArsR family transcriptional regulator